MVDSVFPPVTFMYTTSVWLKLAISLFSHFSCLLTFHKGVPFCIQCPSPFLLFKSCLFFKAWCKSHFPSDLKCPPPACSTSQRCLLWELRERQLMKLGSVRQSTSWIRVHVGVCECAYTTYSAHRCIFQVLSLTRFPSPNWHIPFQ